MPSQSDKAATLRALHRGPRAFVIANAWDAGSARALAALGFPALATSSGAQAGVLGRRDGAVTRDEALAHCRAIVAATDLPVSADLEKGFGDAPAAAAETIRPAPGAGPAGGAALSKPFNFMAGIKGKSFTVAELEAAGVRRISLATSLYRAAMTGMLDAAREVRDKGSFGYLDRAIATPEWNAFMQA